MFFASCYPVDLSCQVIVIVIDLLFVLMMLMQASPWTEPSSLFTYDTRHFQWYDSWTRLGFMAWYLCYHWMFFASCSPVDLCCQVIVIVIDLLFILMMLMQASPWIESWSLFTHDTRQFQWYDSWTRLEFMAWYLCYRWMLMKYGSISSKYECYFCLQNKLDHSYIVPLQERQSNQYIKNNMHNAYLITLIPSLD